MKTLMKTDFKTLEIIIKDKVCEVRLNRPDVHNALNDELIYDLYEAFELLNDEKDIRVIVLTGNGKSFCAGADLNWMKSVVNYSYEQNYADSLKLAKLMYLIFTHSKPVIAKVNGAAVGGGVGLLLPSPPETRAYIAGAVLRRTSGRLEPGSDARIGLGLER